MNLSCLFNTLLTGLISICSFLSFPQQSAAEDTADWQRQLINRTHCVELKSDQWQSQQFLCVYDGDGIDDWFLLDDYGITEMKNYFSMGWTIADISISPDKTQLVLVETEEGHPTISLYDITDWDGKNSPAQIWGFSTYPGSVGVAGWDGNHLVAASDHDLTDPNGGHLDSDPSESFAYYLVHRNGLVEKFHGKLPDDRD